MNRTAVKNILLTGATGTIGSALVPRLTLAGDSAITLLIRARDDRELLARFEQMLSYWKLAPGSAPAARLRPLRGDITLPGFGLTAEAQARLAHETTHIIHCAASVKLNMPLEQAQATAVMPTRTVLALGRQGMLRGRLQKIDMVSTVGVWGRAPGHMPEQRLPDVEHFHNTYEAAKAEAERVIWSEGDGLPITVHRPSMVVGDSHTGQVIHFQVFYHLCEFLSGARTFGIMPALGDTRLDTVPVDWVADAICWASNHPETAGQIYHLCTGPDASISLPRLQRVVREAWRVRGLPLPALRVIDRHWLERLIPVIGMFAGARTRRALRGLSPVLAYLAEDQGFSNTATALQLSAAGLPVPKVETYLDKVLGYYFDKRAARSGA